MLSDHSESVPQDGGVVRLHVKEGYFLPHLKGLAHVSGVPHLHVNKPSSNYDDDHNDDFNKTTGLIIKTTALHVHHAF